ncbi:hypothetical protein KM043_002218 [Ampulex compressa]|nr:hypothetical protein KM043_002218 [Ampulex compressa]
MSTDSGRGDSLATPRRAQKCLFGSNNSAIKKHLYRDQKSSNTIIGSSGDDSDLGPMSPLALTDQSPSSCDSSPGREYISPLENSENSLSPSIMYMSWDRLTSGSNKNNSNNLTSPFSTLKKITKAARHSPRRKIFPNTPKSLPTTPQKNVSKPSTPNSSKVLVTSNEIIPETPHRNFGRELQNDIVETPCKDNSPHYRLITPLGSESKMIPLPRLHRRKSISVLETSEGSSPERKENTLKRHAHEMLGGTGSKLLKTDENCSIPKARAALFQEKKCNAKLQNFTLSTKSFYSSEKKECSMNFNTFREAEHPHRRRSLPANGLYNRRSGKRYKLNAINAGVSHGIRRPKSKHNLDTSKKNTSNTTQNSNDLKESPAKVLNEIRNNIPHAPVVRAPSPEIDLNKRFFKTNRTIKQQNVATVTVNGNIKLKVADGKIALSQVNSHSTKNVHKRAKLVDASFDATDLTVDEPEIEGSLEENKVANILKVLEEDWLDDDYDTMEKLTVQTFKTVTSPLKSMTIPNDVTMSPASELSNMTSTMNIEDITAVTTFQNAFNNTASKEALVNGELDSQKKYYPLFTKGYSDNKSVEEISSPKSVRGVKRSVNWQLSAKGGGADENQYQLDAGQKRFGATQCPECNVVYELGVPEDENAHLNYHNSTKILKFPGWKNERVILEEPFNSSRVILIEPGDSKQYWNKVANILTVVDMDLGLADMQISEYRNKKVYLYIRNQSVLGVLVAEHIKTAHRMIPDLLELDCCTAESTPVKCGINVVWTAMSHRRQGIATKLVNTLRAKFYYGYIMSLDDIAFSIPTPSGKIFAEKYTQTRNFKVYS